jgi:hypothetical protein
MKEQIKKYARKHINLLKPTGYMMHQQVQYSTFLRSAHTVFMYLAENKQGLVSLTA